MNEPAKRSRSGTERVPSKRGCRSAQTRAGARQSRPGVAALCNRAAHPQRRARARRSRAAVRIATA
jgi:hypothetical protein